MQMNFYSLPDEIGRNVQSRKLEAYGIILFFSIILFAFLAPVVMAINKSVEIN